MVWQPLASADLWEVIGVKPGQIGLLSDSGIIGASQSNFDIVNIPASFTHLFLMLQLRSDRAANVNDDMLVRFNNDSGNNYYTTTADFYHSSSSHTDESNGGSFILGGMTPAATTPANWLSAHFMFIPFYTQAATYFKQVLTVGAANITNSATGSRPTFGSGIYIGTAAAISRITILPRLGSNWAAGSGVALFGIK